jgi:hypothetical protein
LRKVGKPESWISLRVLTDGFEFRQADLTGEALYHLLIASKPEQAETRGRGYVVQGGR